MANKMIIDASHPEETRVVVLRGNRVEEFDFESASKRPLRGNIYLAKVTRVEPSLQAAFVDYGGNRHGFLAFSEIHPDYYQIPVADRQALLEEEALFPARGGRRGQRRTTQPASSAPAPPEVEARVGTARRFRSPRSAEELGRTNRSGSSSSSESERPFARGWRRRMHRDRSATFGGDPRASSPRTASRRTSARGRCRLRAQRRSEPAAAARDAVFEAPWRCRGRRRTRRRCRPSTTSSTRSASTRTTITKSRRSKAAPRSA